MIGPEDLPHTFKKRRITDDNCVKNGCTMHGEVWSRPDKETGKLPGLAEPVCDVCGGSKGRVVHTLEPLPVMGPIAPRLQLDMAL